MDQKNLTLFFLWCWFELERKRQMGRARNRAYRLKNPERVLALNRAWRAANQAKANAGSRAWYAANREAALESCRNWEAKNPEKKRGYVRTWHANNREYFRDRNKNDPGYHLLRLMRKRVWEALQGATKSAQTLELVGCSIPDLKQHLQNQFQPEMTWENYGEWHVDHIRPCSSFDLTDPAQQRECFNFQNLQPLWAIDNLKKGDKYLAS